MKKTALMIGCAIMLSLSMVFTGCKKDNNDDNNTGGGGTTTENIVTVGNDSYTITSALYYLDEEYDQVSVNFASGNRNLIFDFDNKTSIPVGTFEIGDDTGVDAYLSAPEGWLDAISGTITISKSGNNYIVKAEGIATPERENKTFTCTYTGPISIFVPTACGNMNINGTEYPIYFGAYSVVTEQGVTLLGVTLATEDGDTGIGFAFMNQTSVPVGTFTLSSNPYLGAVAVVFFYESDESYMSTTGTLTISKSGDIYTITSSGNAELSPYGKEAISFSCSFSGELIQAKGGMKFMPLK